MAMIPVIIAVVVQVMQGGGACSDRIIMINDGVA